MVQRVRQRETTTAVPFASGVVVRASAPELVEVSKLIWWLRHPRRVERPARPVQILREAVTLLRSARSLTVELTDDVAGRQIRAYLLRRRLGVRRRLYAKSVLTIPAQGHSAFSGRRMQAARTNMRRASERGLVCREDTGSEAEPGQRTYRLFDAEGSIAGTLGVTIDRDWALVDYLVSDEPNGFYLLHGHVVGELQRLGVGHVLINSENAPLLAPGLLYMQGRMGYEVVHLRLDG